MSSKIEIKKLAHFAGHLDCVYALEKSMQTDCVYSGAAEGYIVEWNYKLQSDGKLISKVLRPVYCLKLLKDKNILLAGTASGNLHVIDLENNQELKNFELHTLGLFDLKTHKNFLVSAGGDGTISILDQTNFSLVHKIIASDKSARIIAMKPDGAEFAVGFSDHKIRIYNAENFELKTTITQHSNSVFALAYSPDGNYLVSGGRDAMMNIYDTKNNFELLKNIAAHNLHIHCIYFNTNGKLFATSSMDKTIKIWDAENFELLKVIDKSRHEGHVSSVNKLLWLDDENIISCSDDKTIMCFRTQIVNKLSELD